MSDKSESKKEEKITPWVIAVLAIIVVGIATWMNYGSSLRSHAAPADTTTAPSQ